MSNNNKTPLVPKLRFPEFRGAEGWKEASLGSVASLRNGYAFKSSEYVADGPYQIITIANVQQNNLTTESTKRIAELPSDIQQHQTLSLDDILISMTGNVGRVCRVTAEGLLLNQRVGKLIPEKITDAFFYQVLQREDFRNSMQLKAAGGAQGNLSTGGITDYTFKIPSAPAEQKKIADCLSSLDELIAAQARKVDALKTHKKGLMQQLFPREGETQPRLRFPEFRDAGKWKKMALSAAANFYNGRAYKQEELLEAGKYKVLRVGNFFTNNNWYHSNLELDETKYCQDGDLLYAWSASFGPRVWRGEKTIYHYHIWKVVEQPGIDRQFLFIILEHETERMKAKTTNGLGIMHITKGAIESWESFFPGLAEQKKVAHRLMNLDRAIGAEARKLESLTEHKRGLMQQLFPSIDDIKI